MLMLSRGLFRYWNNFCMNTALDEEGTAPQVQRYIRTVYLV